VTLGCIKSLGTNVETTPITSRTFIAARLLPDGPFSPRASILWTTISASSAVPLPPVTRIAKVVFATDHPYDGDERGRRGASKPFIRKEWSTFVTLSRGSLE